MNNIFKIRNDKSLIKITKNHNRKQDFILLFKFHFKHSLKSISFIIFEKRSVKNYIAIYRRNPLYAIKDKPESINKMPKFESSQNIFHF